MSTQNPPASTYTGQFSNQTLPVIAFSAAMRALRNKAGMVRWTKNKDFAGLGANKGEAVPIPYVGRMDVQDVTPGPTVASPTSIANQTEYVKLDQWRQSEPFSLNARELGSFEMSSIVPRSLERSLQAVAEDIEDKVAALYYKFPAIAGSNSGGVFASNNNALGALHTAMSNALFPNGIMKGLFISSADVGELIVLDVFQKNAQLAGLSRAETQYGMALLGEMLRHYMFENQFTKTHTAGDFDDTGAITVDGAAAKAAKTIDVAVAAGGTFEMLKGDVLLIPVAAAPGGTYAVAIDADVTIAATASGTVTLTQPLEWAMAGGEVIAFDTTLGAAGTQTLQNMCIAEDAIAIVNRVLNVNDIAAVTGGVFNVTDDDDAENAYEGTGMTFTLKREPGSNQEQWYTSLFYGVGVADARLGGRLLSA